MNARCFLLSAIAAAGVLLGLAGPVRADEIVIPTVIERADLHGTILSENNQEVQVNLEGTAIRIRARRSSGLCARVRSKPTDSKTAKITRSLLVQTRKERLCPWRRGHGEPRFRGRGADFARWIALAAQVAPMRKKMVLLYANAGNDIATRRKAVQAQADLIVYCPEQYEAVRGELLNASGQLAASCCYL
jgi:hypothetical protein